MTPRIIKTENKSKEVARARDIAREMFIAFEGLKKYTKDNARQ